MPISTPSIAIYVVLNYCATKATHEKEVLIAHIRITSITVKNDISTWVDGKPSFYQQFKKIVIQTKKNMTYMLYDRLNDKLSTQSQLIAMLLSAGRVPDSMAPQPKCYFSWLVPDACP